MTSTQLLKTGIPRITELDQLKQTETYRGPSDFNTAFLARHHNALQKYGRHWGNDPFKLWSRRWEYPFVAQRVLDFAQRPENIGRNLKIMDAGSGVTFFPYYICSKNPSAQFVCVDYDPTYTAMFDAINRAETARVRFLQASLQKLPLADGELDAIACISVLEHTDNYAQIIDEFLRVLRPGGMFVLTFDLSLDGKFTLPLPQAKELLRVVQSKFQVDDGVDLVSELSHSHDAGVLTSDHVRDTEPELLPWTFPVRVYKAAQDLMTGKGWTLGFRSRTIFCCSVRKPAT
ncbi:MAG: class I SAM-dependent methyltransferase [Anaerolineae bacterium]|nr:class I SAM-dependent methyltransferase [Phycisphaerae bacterium]